jgi:hypothetical protein
MSSQPVLPTRFHRARKAPALLSALLCVAALPPLAGGEPEPVEAKVWAPNLPRVPARAAILKNVSGDETAAIKQWAQTLIEGKEKRALVELADIKKQVKKEEAARLQEEEDARTRQTRYDQTWRTLRMAAGPERRGPLHIRLDFMVPEIRTCRLAAEVSRVRQALADDVVAMLGRLDRNGDGKLAGDEYRDAGALANATAALFSPLDSDGDGYLTAEELVGARNLPESAPAALRAGQMTVQAKDFRIKPFDKDGNGSLGMDERKAMTMSYVDASLRAAQDAAFYTNVADSLAAARNVVASKFADVEVAP